MASTDSLPVPELERLTIKRVGWALIPFLMICYLVSFIDRVNAGFAAFQMNKDLGLTASLFGLGGGLISACTAFVVGPWSFCGVRLHSFPACCCI